MIIKTSSFVKSSPDWIGCPETNLPEFAFIGRSNVGKSSFINMLTNRQQLAKTSSKPGKTKLINHFLINDTWYLVDLPGYGYSRTSKELRIEWDKMIMDYIRNRKNLYYLCVLIDSRLLPQKLDISFLEKLGEMEIPFLLIFTKSDKQSQIKTMKNVNSFIETISEQWEELPPYFITSAVRVKGKEEFLTFINKTIHEINL
ncbi:MAG: YihA family ribosome biogenesis GTP-binding protein [Bacteroidales bacterium]|nr:YihA family ribosome biogenesis GTP-binding protein [Bacteroidales bacterium]